MLDRQKLEAILANRFRGASSEHLAAAANQIMGLAEHRSGDRRRAHALINTSTTVSVSTCINAPIRRVFELFTDLDHSAAHVSAIRDIQRLNSGPFGLGTRWRESREILGRVDTADMEVTAFDNYRTYTISHHKGGIRIETVFSFEPDSDGARVTIEFALDGAGLPPGLLTPLNWAIAGKVRHVLTQDLTDLKNCLEDPQSTGTGELSRTRESAQSPSSLAARERPE
jgi:uncharacterized protein YndB with AHSA1/START domain